MLDDHVDSHQVTPVRTINPNTNPAPYSTNGDANQVPQQHHHSPSALATVTTHYGLFGPPPLTDSPSTSSLTSLELSTVTSRLGSKYRYHVFFACHATDEEFVTQLVSKLESDAATFRCGYPSRCVHLCAIITIIVILFLLAPIKKIFVFCTPTGTSAAR